MSILPSMRLDGKVALITGSCRGLGYGIALAFASAGADLIVTCRNKEHLIDVSEAIKAIGRHVICVEVDVRFYESIQKMVNKALEEYGKIDILMNNAGRGGRGYANQIEQELWDDIMNTNLKGLFFCGQSVANIMIKQGSGKIVNMSSVLGAVGIKQTSVYSASKAGIIQLTKSWALEWAPYNINVNAIAPAFIETEMTLPTFSTEKFKTEVFSKTPLKRYGKIEDVTGAAVFLASDASNYITGQTLFIDGGWLTQ